MKQIGPSVLTDEDFTYIENQQAAVRADAMNTTIFSDEIGVWASEAQKQQWHINKAGIDAAISRIRERCRNDPL